MQERMFKDLAGTIPAKLGDKVALLKNPTMDQVIIWSLEAHSIELKMRLLNNLVLGLKNNPN
jgi:hypothetical protein